MTWWGCTLYMRWQWYDNAMAISVTWKQSNNDMTMAWKYHNYNMIMRSLYHSCTMTMARTWQHICTHVYLLDNHDIVMTGLWGEYDTSDVTTTWQWHYHKMTMRWPWYYCHVLLESWSWYGHRVIMLLSVLGCVRVVSSSCYHHDMAVALGICHWWYDCHKWSFVIIHVHCFAVFWLA